MTDAELCPICKKPKESDSRGLATLLIDICRCGIGNQDQQEITVTICSNCGKSISSREGSLTQWIFGKGRCECSRSEPIEKQIKSIPQTVIPGFSIDPDEEIELKLDPANFPVDRFKAVAEIGKGTSGLVYLCRDKLLGKKVAVKALRKLSPEQLISFQEEARATSKLNHPNIVKILDMGATESGTPYIVLDYIEGTNLQDYLLNVGVPDIPIAQNIFQKLADALKYAHEQKIYHRDIKPSNIVVFDTDDGIDVKLIDFGVATAAQATQEPTIFQDKEIAGTPAYMAPDTVNGLEYDERSEVYSLGCVLFETLTGQQPYSGDTALELLKKHAHESIPDPVTLRPELEEYPGLVDTIVQSMRKDQKSRIQSMNALKEQLQPDRMVSDTGVRDNQDISLNHKTPKSHLPAFWVAGFLILSVAIVIPFTNYLGSGTKNNSNEKKKPQLWGSMNSEATKGDNSSREKDAVTKCGFESAIGGPSVIYFTEKIMRIEWQGIVTIFLGPPNYDNLKIQYVSIDGYAKETIDQWMRKYSVLNPNSKIRNVHLIGKETIIDLPCNHYQCEVSDTKMDFWTTSALPINSQLRDVCCRIVDVPAGFGLPIKASRSFTYEQARKLLSSQALGMLKTKEPWKGVKTIKWMKVTSIETEYAKEKYSSLFPANAFNESSNLD